MAIEFDTGGLANVRKYTINDLPQRTVEVGQETGKTIVDIIELSRAAREEGAVYVEAKKAKNAKTIVPVFGKGDENA